MFVDVPPPQIERLDLRILVPPQVFERAESDTPPSVLTLETDPFESIPPRASVILIDGNRIMAVGMSFHWMPASGDARYWVVRVRANGVGADGESYADSRTCPAVTSSLASLTGLAVPTPELPNILERGVDASHRGRIATHGSGPEMMIDDVDVVFESDAAFQEGYTASNIRYSGGSGSPLALTAATAFRSLGPASVLMVKRTLGPADPRRATMRSDWSIV